MYTFIAPCFEQNISYIDSQHEHVILILCSQGDLLKLSMYTASITAKVETHQNPHHVTTVQIIYTIQSSTPYQLLPQRHNHWLKSTPYMLNFHLILKSLSSLPLFFIFSHGRDRHIHHSLPSLFLLLHCCLLCP